MAGVGRALCGAHSSSSPGQLLPQSPALLPAAGAGPGAAAVSPGNIQGVLGVLQPSPTSPALFVSWLGSCAAGGDVVPTLMQCTKPIPSPGRFYKD